MSCRSTYKKEEEVLPKLGLESGQKSSFRATESPEGSSILDDPGYDSEAEDAANILLTMKRAEPLDYESSSGSFMKESSEGEQKSSSEREEESSSEREEEEDGNDSEEESDFDPEPDQDRRRLNQQNRRRRGLAVEKNGGKKYKRLRPAMSGGDSDKPYTPAQKDFLVASQRKYAKENEGRSIPGAQLAEKFNQRFGQDRSKSGIMSEVCRLRKKGRV